VLAEIEFKTGIHGVMEMPKDIGRDCILLQPGNPAREKAWRTIQKTEEKLGINLKLPAHDFRALVERSTRPSIMNAQLWAWRWRSGSGSQMNVLKSSENCTNGSRFQEKRPPRIGSPHRFAVETQMRRSILSAQKSIRRSAGYPGRGTADDLHRLASPMLPFAGHGNLRLACSLPSGLTLEPRRIVFQEELNVVMGTPIRHSDFAKHHSVVRFSIITRYRNSAWLKPCIASVATSRSSRNTLSRMRARTMDARWLLRTSASELSLKKDQGMYDGINRGLRRAGGDIFGLLELRRTIICRALCGPSGIF